MIKNNTPIVDRREQKEEIFQVEGMMCASCVKHVESALLGLGGVVSASASLKTGQVTIGYDPMQVSPGDMRHAIEAAGFRAA